MSPYFVFPKWLLLGEAHFLGKPQKGLPEKRRTRISMGFATSKAHKRETQGKYFYLVFIILEICCFRHLEKPIKTKENKRKHFFSVVMFFVMCFCFYMFLLVLSCFFRWRKQIVRKLNSENYFQRNLINPFLFSFRTRNARMERKFRLFCVFRVHVYINHRFSGSHRCKSRAQARYLL